MRGLSKITGIMVIIFIILFLLFSLLAQIPLEKREYDVLNKNFELGSRLSQSYELYLDGQSEIKINLKSTEPINFYIMSEENHIRRIGPNWKSFISEYEVLNTKAIDTTLKLNLYGKYYVTFSNWEGSRDTYIETKITKSYYGQSYLLNFVSVIFLLSIFLSVIVFLGSLVPTRWDEKLIRNNFVFNVGIVIEVLAGLFFLNSVLFASFLLSLIGLLFFSIDVTNYPVRSKVYTINSILWTIFWASVSFFILNNSKLILLIVIIGAAISIFVSKKKSKQMNNERKNIIEINYQRRDSSLEYLKNFEKLSEKEIISFFFLKNNPTTDKEKLSETFGKDIIEGLIRKGFFIENEEK